MGSTYQVIEDRLMRVGEAVLQVLAHDDDLKA
jgi:hypothetical protein